MLAEAGGLRGDRRVAAADRRLVAAEGDEADGDHEGGGEPGEACVLAVGADPLPAVAGEVDGAEHDDRENHADAADETEEATAEPAPEDAEAGVDRDDAVDESANGFVDAHLIEVVVRHLGGAGVGVIAVERTVGAEIAHGYSR